MIYVVQVVGVSDIVVHPSYSSTSSSPTNNLALVRLTSPAAGSYRRLCLPAQNSVVSGEVQLVGWRISAVLGSLSESLVTRDTQIVSDCGAGADKVCTSEDTRCQGDTGAPLVKSDTTLVGAMTGGAGCSTVNYGVFTNIASKSAGHVDLPPITLLICRIYNLDPEHDII